MPFWKKKPKESQDDEMRAALYAANPALAAEVDRGRERRAASDELHAHEISADDAALIRMMDGSHWGDDASLTLPSGKTVTGREARRWIDADAPSRKDPSRTPAFRRATLDEYVAWLRPWLAAGNQPTHYYDRPFGRQKWLTAERDFTTGGECGALSTEIIVPAGIKHLGGGIGHNQLYFMDGQRHLGHVVPIFDDPVFRTLSDDIPAFISAKKAEVAAWRRESEAMMSEAVRRSRRSDVGRYLHPED